MTPSLPQRGRHPKGSIPLTPIFYEFFLNVFHRLLTIGEYPGDRSENFGVPLWERSPLISGNFRVKKVSRI
jgi:hypothetical protein